MDVLSFRVVIYALLAKTASRVPWLATSIFLMGIIAPAVCLATAPRHRPLVTRIAYSDAIVMAEVVRTRAIPVAPPETIWRANTSATVRVTEVLRGNVPKTLTARIAVSEPKPCKVGDKVVLFISKLNDDGSVDVFEGAQGFVPLDALEHTWEDAQTDRALYRAVLRLIALEDHHDAKNTRQPPRFSPAGEAVLFDLLESDNAKVWHYAVSWLSDLSISDEMAQQLVALIQETDDLARNAAVAYVAHRFAPEVAVAQVARYARSLPLDSKVQSGPRRTAFGFLARNAPEKYDYAAALEASLTDAEPSVHHILRESLAALPDGYEAWLEYRVDENRAFTVVQHRRTLDPEEVQRFTRSLKLPEMIAENFIPFSCEIRIWRPTRKKWVQVSVR